MLSLVGFIVGVTRKRDHWALFHLGKEWPLSTKCLRGLFTLDTLTASSPNKLNEYRISLYASTLLPETINRT